MTLHTAIAEVVGRLQIMSSSDDNGKPVWNSMMSDIRRNNSIQGKHVAIIEREISNFINETDDANKKLIWQQTETGIADPDGADSIPISSIEMDLESELLDEITQYAFEDSARHD